MGAGVKPGVAAAHDFYLEFFAFEVDAVDVGYLEFSACAGFDIFCDFDDVVVVEVEARYCVAGFGFFGFFFDGDGLFVGVEFDDAVAFRVGDRVGEDGGPFIVGVGGLQYFAEVVAVKDVVAKDEGRGVAANEVGTKNKGLGKAIRAGLYDVLEIDAPLTAITEQLLKARGVLRGGDDEDVFDARQHEGGERVVDHRFVVDR